MPSKTLYSQIDHIDRLIILPSPECHEQSSASSLTVRQLNAKDQRQLSYAMCEEWGALHKGRPLKIVVCGQEGHGKSTLINNFLGLSISKGAITGRTGIAVTTEVRPYEKEVKGIKVVIFDTPGFLFSNEKTLQYITEVTGGEVDLLYYCINLRIGRLNEVDIEVFKLLSMFFGKELWKHTIFILTFANEECQRQGGVLCYWKNLKQRISECLERIGVSKMVAQSITVALAGKSNALLNYHDGYQMNWKENLFIESLRMTNPKGIPALLHIHMSDEELAMIDREKERERYAGGILGWLFPGERPLNEVNPIVKWKYKIWKKQTQK